MDRFSDLPESVMENIVERLLQKDRVRTGALSKKWRFLWKQIPSLLLGSEFYSSVRKAKSRPITDYLCIINGLMLQLKRHALNLTLFIPSDVGVYGVWLFDQIITFFLSNGVQRLSIEKDGATPYRLPSSMMCFTFPLTHLQLCNCDFSPPSSFEGFSTLISFELRRCQATADVISHFVTTCPTLQQVELKDLNFPNQSLDIDAPELRHLFVHGKFKWLFLLNVVNVEVLTIDMETLPDSWEGLPPLVSTFFDGMPKLEKIILGCRFSQLLGRHSDSLKFANYDGLRSLAFVQLQTSDVLVYVSNSIKCFPNLTDLTISWADGADGADGLAELKNEDNGYDFTSLLRADYQNIRGTSFWMKLIECSLRSPVLKLMSLKFDSRIRQDEILDHVRQVTKLRRASITAEIDIAKCAYTAPPCSSCVVAVGGELD